ncbi:MAG: reverse transcriptase domain-containing protein [Armatimonadota bacterium]
MSVHSNDGATWSTKLQRVGELSVHDKDLVFNNLGHIISIEWLRDLYRQLDGSKAIGIDGVSKESYGTNLEQNLSDLIKRIRRGQYLPKLARITEVPKEDGSTRPLAISCLEDKLVQLAASKILSKIYEPLFLPSSYGFRPGLNCHDALKALIQATYKMQDGAVVEIDIRKYFNTIPHGPLFELLGKKIGDQRFLKLLDVLVKAPTLQDGKILANESGSPQGSILSPILANIYLHHVIDEWFAAISKSHLKGNALEIRYADDMVFVFQYASQAEKFYKVLVKRLGKYGLEIHNEKSRLIPSGSRAAARAHAIGERIPPYKFVGFTCYWGLSLGGKFWRLKVKSRSDRKRAKLAGLRQFLEQNRNTSDTPHLMSRVKAVVRGWANYHAVSDNQRQVSSFIYESKHILFKWFNRRGGRKRWNWKRFVQLLEKINFPTVPKLVSLYPTPNRAKA